MTVISDLARFVRERYRDWAAGREAPLLSPHVVKQWVAPELESARQHQGQSR